MGMAQSLRFVEQAKYPAATRWDHLGSLLGSIRFAHDSLPGEFMIDERERYEALKRLAYQSWLDRGQPMGCPEIDWAIAEQKLAAQEILNASAELSAAADEPRDEYEIEIPELSVPVDRRRRKSTPRTQRR